MKNIFNIIAKVLTKIAFSTLETYSWLGIFEPKPPQSFLNHKK